ncbi:NPP1 family protein, partial [Candidatus Bathyarchaeota archaeon]|nr:NPP1 family protein [Candidatus Bathyarchaeota archaeon]
CASTLPFPPKPPGKWCHGYRFLYFGSICHCAGGQVHTNGPLTRYEFYFEKDQVNSRTFISGHKHDWENVVVFVKNAKVIHTAVSCHGKYGGGSNTILGGENKTHPYIVYHKDSTFTHCFREASGADIAGPENFSGEFYASPVIGYAGWPADGLAWNGLLKAFPDGVSPKIQEKYYGDYLKMAAGDNVPGFDPYVDVA